MNPMNSSYHGTNALDAALIGRFATFLYPPEALDMEESDRIRVVQHINGDDAPSLSEWLPSARTKTVDSTQTTAVGHAILDLLRQAASSFVALQRHYETLGEFLSRLSVLVLKETNGKVKLDGRRLGFMYRNVLAMRAIELARQSLWNEPLPDFVDTARKALLASIPIGINQDGINKEEFLHKSEICLDLLSDYFRDGSNLARVETIYRLFTGRDLVEKTKILLRENLTELAKSKAWNDLADSKDDVSVLAYVALQVEAHRPGTVPSELLEKLSGRIAPSSLSTESMTALTGVSVEWIDEVESLFTRGSDLEKVIAYQRVRELTAQGKVDRQSIAAARQTIQQDVETLRNILINREVA